MTPHGIGCLVVGLVFATAFGLAGARIGWLVGQFGQNLPGELVLLAAIDGFGVACVWYWRSTRRAREYGPWTVFLLFALLGMRFSRGMGVERLLVTGVANGLFGFVVAGILARRPANQERPSAEGGSSLPPQTGR